MNIFFRYNIYIIKITFVVTFALNCIKSDMSRKKMLRDAHSNQS